MMEQPQIARIAGGAKLRLCHGPIDVIVSTEGQDAAREAGFRGAAELFPAILPGLVAELPLLRRPLSAWPISERPKGRIARRMAAAVAPYSAVRFVTPMAAVAGAVADTLLDAVRSAAAGQGTLRRVAVNNGGDISLHLSTGARTTVGLVADPRDGRLEGRLDLSATDKVGGIATSGWHGRSFSRGIADAVTVLAPTAAAADAAATLIANAVDLPGHPAIDRRPAQELAPDSDLGERLVTVGVRPLAVDEIDAALDAGLAEAERLLRGQQILGAALFLCGRTRLLGLPRRVALARLAVGAKEKVLMHA